MQLQKCRRCRGTGKEIDHEKTGRELRELRLACGLSLRQAAREMKISAPYLCDLEKGQRTWTEDRINQYREMITQ